MLKRNWMRTAILIALFIDLVLVTVLLCMCLKWFVNFLEIKAIAEIWPEGEFVLLQCGLIFFAVASIIFCVRMLYIDFERQTLLTKVEQYEMFGNYSDKALDEDGKPKVRRVTIPKTERNLMKKAVISPEESSEITRLRKELAAEKQWRKNANELYPDIEDRVADYIENCPM